MSTTLITQLQKSLAQGSAPSYLHVPDDGAPFTCTECKRRDRGHFVKPFTPDNKNQGLVHFDCLDPDWLAIAKDMGQFK